MWLGGRHARLHVRDAARSELLGAGAGRERNPRGPTFRGDHRRRNVGVGGAGVAHRAVNAPARRHDVLVSYPRDPALEFTGLIPRRDTDVIGIGYFHTELSDDFKGTVGPLLSAAATLNNRAPTRITIEDTDGFEAYYKAQITPWVAVTGDVQVITATLSSEDTKLVTGLRGKLTF